jgi:hypothetical protein
MLAFGFNAVGGGVPAQNPLLEPTGSSASGWRLSLPGRAFAFSWSLSSLRLATAPLIDSPFPISDPGL